MLPTEQDAFGLMLHDHLWGVEAREVVERDDGYIDVSAGPALYFASIDQWSRHTRAAMRHLRGPVLDVGCGAGRLALYAQEQGLEVLATDISPLAVAVCHRRGVRRAEVVAFEELGPALGAFATIAMLGNNFGLTGSREGAIEFLERAKAFTTPDARIIAESMDPYATENPDHLGYHERNRARGRMAGQIRLRVRYRTAATPWIDYLFVSVEEMEGILAGTGWEIRELLHSDGPSYIAVIERTA